MAEGFPRGKFTKSMSLAQTDDDYIEEWMKNNEESAQCIVENWLFSHPQIAKSLYKKYGHFLGMEAITPLSRTSTKKSMRHYISAPSVGKKRKPAEELRKLEKQQLFVELLKDVLSPEVDTDHLGHKILLNVLLLTKADRSSLFLKEGPQDGKILVSRLFDITENTSVADAIHTDDEAIKMPVGVGIAGTVAKTGEAINLKNAYEDPRFNPDVDIATGYQTKSILCMPIKAPDGQVIGVAQVINKNNGVGVFTAEDEEDFKMYLNFCAIGIQNAQLFDHSFSLSRRLQILLDLAKGLFEDTTNLEVVINKVMKQSIELIPCQTCSVMLLDKDCKTHSAEDIMFSQSFQVENPNILKNCEINIRSVEVDTISDLDFAKQAAATAMPIIKSNVGEQREGKVKLTLCSGTKSILCVPIFNKDGQVLGVVKLTNRLHQTCFTGTDMESLEIFATFCGLGLHNVMMYEEIAIASARNKVAFEVLSYHASSSVEDANRLQKLQVPEASAYNLHSFQFFNDRLLSEDHTVLASVRIFLDSGVAEAFKINAKVLYRWILTVKKNYRPVTYHNWRHAFNVAQMMFAMFKDGKMAHKLTKVEQFALLVACFCHDLDHRGTNNAFQVKSGSVLAQLYTTSTMEHHHFDHCIMILNSEGNQILNELSPSKYASVLSMLEHAILSTDLALYFKKRDGVIESVNNKTYNWEDKESDREVFRGMLMTACDVGAITKPFKIQRNVAHMVTAEFFEQGDRERNDLQVEPSAMMDRSKKDELPKMQIGFIDFVCLPLYKMLSEVNPEFRPLLDGLQTNRNNWELLSKDPNAIPNLDSEESEEQLMLPNTTITLPPSPTEVGPSITETRTTTTTTTWSPPDPVVTEGPIVGWRNSTGSEEATPSTSRKEKVKSRSQPSTHAEVTSTRKHLKCAMS